jgi:hypothetical protein
MFGIGMFVANTDGHVGHQGRSQIHKAVEPLRNDAKASSRNPNGQQML